MLTDERLEHLLRTARDVDTLERMASQGPARGVLLRSRPMARVFAVSAIAAGIVLGLGVAMWVKSAVTPAPRVPSSGPSVATVPEAPAAAGSARGSVLLAVVEDEIGNLQCVNWTPWLAGGRSIQETGTEELCSLGMALSCDPAPRRLLVVGLEGPRESLPTSNVAAANLARCILNMPPCTGTGTFDPGRCAQAGGQCLSSQVSMRVEVVAGMPGR